MSKRRRKSTFKPYDSHQMSLLPPSLDEFIPQNHVVRIVKCYWWIEYRADTEEV